MPAWWAEKAWLGGAGATDSVLFDVKDDRIASVSPGVATPPAGSTRLAGLTLPGLANVHSHSFHRALRGRSQDGRGTFWTWRDLMYSVAERIDPDSYMRLARAVFCEMVLAGFTAVGEFHYLHHSPGGVPYKDPNEMGLALMEAARSAGIRLTLLDTCYLAGGFDKPLEGPQLRFGDGSAERWQERVAELQPDGEVRVGAAVHSVRALPPSDVEAIASWVREKGWRLHAHVSEQRLEHAECVARLGQTPLGVLEDSGAIGPSFTAVHGTHLSTADIGRLAGAGAGCCVCPTTERDLGDGIGPAVALHRAGVPLSLGTDSHAVIDGFEEARAMELDSRLASEQRGLLTSTALLEAVTVNGMSALGWDAGELAPGRVADFVSIRLDTVRTSGCDPRSPATPVFAASAADVDSVVIGGRQVVSGGCHSSLADLGSELAAVISALWA